MRPFLNHVSELNVIHILGSYTWVSNSVAVTDAGAHRQRPDGILARRAAAAYQQQFPIRQYARAQHNRNPIRCNLFKLRYCNRPSYYMHAATNLTMESWGSRTSCYWFHSTVRSHRGAGIEIFQADVQEGVSRLFSRFFPPIDSHCL